MLAKQFYTEGVESLSDILFNEYKITLHPSTIYRILKRNDIKHRKDSVGPPEQNGKIERFHQALKRAYRYRIPYNSFIDEMQYKLTLFNYYYNFKKDTED